MPLPVPNVRVGKPSATPDAGQAYPPTARPFLIMDTFGTRMLYESVNLVKTAYSKFKAEFGYQYQRNMLRAGVPTV